VLFLVEATLHGSAKPAHSHQMRHMLQRFSAVMSGVPDGWPFLDSLVIGHPWLVDVPYDSETLEHYLIKGHEFDAESKI